MKKRILAMLLALTMLIGMVPVQAFATETEPAEAVEQIIEATEAAEEAYEEETEELPEESTAPAETEEAREESILEEEVVSPEIQEEAVTSEAAAPAKVTVTIGANGELKLVRKEVTVKDLDGDGLLTFDEAMVAAHTAYYPDGAEGYVSLPGSYGLQVGMLWGIGDGNFLNGMFFTNNVTNAMNVGESYVEAGDDLYAAVLYNDVDFYDWYSYFDKSEVTVKAGEEFTLTLNGFPGMTWGDPVSYALSGVSVGTWDETFTALSGKTTNASGEVTLSFAQAGTYVVSASGTAYDESMGMECPIIAPACVVTVEPAPEPEVIGAVRVIVENTTFTGEDAAWSGTLVDTQVPLLDNMTMMTAILTALDKAGHTWEGTGGDDPNGYGITYIGSIFKNGTEELAEFHGGQDSGWMGTLNDWFVNRGFEQWKAGEDLLDGDVIRVMYTRSRGADIGGGFGTNEGWLGSLSASEGTLDPAFDKNTLAYTLTVEENVTSVNIAAAAENKEDKVTVSVGSTEYRRGEGVAVAEGTQITVTCGEKTYYIDVEVAEPAPSVGPNDAIIYEGNSWPSADGYIAQIALKDAKDNVGLAWSETYGQNVAVYVLMNAATFEDNTTFTSFYTTGGTTAIEVDGGSDITISTTGLDEWWNNMESEYFMVGSSSRNISVCYIPALYTFDKTELTLEPNAAEKITPSTLPYASNPATWTTSDASVAAVAADGTVTAVGYGTATITATVGNFEATCEVTVAAASEPPVPFSQAISVPSNGDSSWGNINGLTLSGTDGSIYEAYWSSTSNNNFVLDVILGQDTDLNAEITAAFSTAGLRKPTISGDLTVTLVDGKGTINMHAAAWNNAIFYPNTDWTINLIVDDGFAANRPTYAVTLPTNTVGYTVTAYNSESPVIGGRSFSFKIAIDSTYTKGDDFKVLANGVDITTSSDTYTLTNITEDITVTVEGVREKTVAELNVTIIAPQGSVISTGKFYSYFRYDFDEPLEVTTLDDGRIQYIAPVPGSQNFLRVQHPDGVTYWTFDGMGAGSRFEITEEMLFIGSDEFTRDTVYHNFEKNVKDKADLYLTVNEKGWLDLATGDTWNLNVFRNFLALGNSIQNDKVALPDTHYQVIDVNGNPSDVVSVIPDANNSCYAEIRAEKPGTAIILVTYDAVYNEKGEGGKQWSAIWPENTGVIVVTVDGAAGDFATNMTVNEEGNAGGKQAIDAEHDILFYTGNKGASFTFKPEDGSTVTVNRSTVGSEMTFSGFTSSGVRTANDGTVTVNGLTTGTHIIQVEKDGKAIYQVVRARQVSFELTHSDGTAITAGNPAQPGETVTVQFHNLVSPLEKLSGVYNANFGFYYNGEDGTTVRSSGGTYGVYTFSGSPSLQKFTFTIPTYWNESTYTLTDGAIRLGGFGGSAGSHRTTTYIEGKEVNTNASGTVGILSVLPDILINTAPCGYYSYNVTLPTGEGYTVTGGSVPVPEGETYTFTVTVAGGYDAENMVVAVNGEAIEAVDGTYAVENVSEDLVIAVEGIVVLPAADMTESSVIYTNGVDGSKWGYDPLGYVQTLTLGGAEVVSYTWEGNTANVVLSYTTAMNDVVGFQVAFAGYSPDRTTATLNGASMTAGVPTSVKLVNGTATVSIYANFQTAGGATKTINLTVQETPDEVVEAVANVEELISAITLPVALEDEEVIRAAWDAYDALDDKVKNLITNADILLQAREELEDLKAVRLASGKSVTLQSTLNGKVTWTMDDEYAPFASVTAAGKVTAKKILEKVSVYAVAADAEGNTETLRVDIYPAVSQVQILNENGDLLNGKTVPVKVNDGSEGIYTFTAGTYPADAMGDVTWTVSDKKGALVTYEVIGSDIILQPAENVKKGTVTLTATAADGSGKKATLKLNIAVLAEDISVTTKDGKNLALDDEGNTIFTVASGMSVTLTAAPTNDNATNKAVTWSVVEGGEYVSVTAAGKLTAGKDLMGVKYAVVRAAAKDGSGAYTDTKVRVTPLALGVQMYNSGRVCTGTTVALNMTAQDTLTLNARVYPLGKANQAVTWTSSSPKIASVTVDENGIATVTCLKAGKVTITATAADGSKEKASVTLNIVQGVESLTLEDQVIAVKKTLNLAKLIQINPAAATNKKLTWSIVGDAHGAVLSASGSLNTAKVDVSQGPVALTVSAAAQDGWGAEPAVCTVTVYPATTKVTVLLGGEAVTGTLELEAGKALTLEGFCEGAANVYTWKSGNKNVQVEDGVVTASQEAVGKTVTVTCTAADGTGKKANVKIKIVAPAEAE